MAHATVDEIKVNGPRLWGRLMAMAAIGATTAGGCNRQAATPEDARGRDLFASWCRELGLSVSIDEVGNMFARREGTDSSALAVLTGSHLDTQPTGGRFDGVYGVLAGLEVISTLNEQGIRTRAPIELAVWTNEEGARFAPACLGSGVFSGDFDLNTMLAATDKTGCRLGDELARIGYKGMVPARPRKLRAAFEAHIEQGPILEKSEKTIGVVTGIQGLRWYDLDILGQSVHAGPTPMAGRKDPARALGTILDSVFDLAERNKPWARATFGDFRATPGVRNTVPNRLTLSVDLRHPDATILDELDLGFRSSVAQACAERDVEGRVTEIWHMPPQHFDLGAVSMVRAAVAAQGYSHMDIVSGATHDSYYVSKVAPTAMIFVPCQGGVSHNEIEYASPEHLEAGCNVLLHAILSASGASSND
jgi:N-carbamoyl-L-amino-acid hydrolase